MKLIYILAVLGLILPLSSLAQDACEKDISTNPMAPYNDHSFPGNKYNPWINSDFDMGALNLGAVKLIELNKQLTWSSDFISVADTADFFMMNPYTSEGTPPARYKYLHPNNVPFVLRDYQWEDGWELLWLGTGFYPNGERINTLEPNRAYPPSFPNPGQSQVPYIALYNRYRGTMRIFMNLVTDFSSYADIRTVLKLPSVENLSGILRHLEPYDRALDQTTNVDKIESFNPKPGDWDQWYSIDYNLGFDPCICGALQEMTIDAQGIDQFELQIYGRGVSVDVPLLQNGQPNYDLDWLTSHDVNSGLAGGNKIYTKLDGLVNDYNTDLAQFNLENQAFQDYQQRQELINAFQGLVVDASLAAVSGGASALLKYSIKPKTQVVSLSDPTFSTILLNYTPPSPNNSASNVGRFIKASGKGLMGYGYDQLMMGVNPKISQPVPPNMPVASYSEMRFSGEITGFSQPATIGPFFVPGSVKEANADPTILNPYKYPAYNAPTGMSALLRTPSPKFRFESTVDEEVVSDWVYPACEQTEKYTNNLDFKMRFDAAPVIALNPSLDFDMDRTASYVMVEVHVEDGLPSQLGSLTTVEKSISGNMFLEYEKHESDKRVYQYNSKWVMLEDLNQHLFGFQLSDEYTLNKNGEWAFDDFDGWYCIPGVEPNYESSDTRKRITKVKIKMLHDYYFDQIGSNGEQVNTMQVFSYLMYDDTAQVNLLGDLEDWALNHAELEEVYTLGSVTLGGEVITTSHPLVSEVIGNEIYINAQEIIIDGILIVQPG